MKKHILFALVIILFSAAITNAQSFYNIYTIVDTTGAAGYSGDAGQATIAEVDNPIHSVPDKLGDLYIADNINRRVREIGVNGIITTVAGTGVQGNTGDGGQATDAELNTPAAVALDDSGNLYICDRGACVIRKVYTSGIITTVAGNGSVGFSGDGGPATAAKLGEPRGVAVDDSGNIFIADFANSCIRKVEKKTDTITTVAGMGYVTGYSGDGGPATAAKLYYAAQLALGDSDDIYIDDLDNNVIRKVNSKGIISTFAGNGTAGVIGENVPATQAELDEPLGVAVDKSGNVYITDYLSQEVRKVDPSGIITTIAGTGATGHSGDGGPALSATMYSAAGINLDTLGNLYISELVSPGNNDIRKLTPCNLPLVYSPAQSLCSGQNVALVISGGSSYTWSPATGLSATTGDSVIANPVSNVTYVVTVTGSGCIVTKNIVVTVVQPPGKPTFYQHGDTLTSSATTDNQWYRNDTLLVGDTSQNLIIHGTSPTNSYYVVVTNEANGCSSSSDTTTAGINQLSAINNQLTVYPNPFANEIFVKINPSADINDWNLIVNDVLGRTLFVKTLLNYSNDIDLSNLSNGIYFITVVNKGERAVFPLVKQN